MSGTIKTYKVSVLTGSTERGRLVTSPKGTGGRCGGCYFLTSALSCPTQNQEKAVGLPGCDVGKHIYLKVEKA